MPKYVVEFGHVGRPPEPDGRLDAPAFHRNHDAIWAVIGPFLAGRTGAVLEIGSGTGQHAAAFAGRSPHIVWQPSDVSERHLASIAAWRAQAGLANLRAPMRIDLAGGASAIEAAARAGGGAFLAILCVNVLHIAPWGVAEALIEGAARTLAPQGRLFVYGPFMRNGRHTAPSNAAFDESLRAQDAAWGVRDVAEIARRAAQAGLALIETVDMPANNMVLVIGRPAPGSA